jgi:trans-aconitate methyltransferase
MTRIVLLGIVCLAAARAQNSPAPDTLASLDQAVQRSLATWNSMAKDLDARVARLLPCDARATAAITDVSRASEGRLTALAEYLRAAAANANVETSAAKVLLNRETARASDDSPERADTAEELAAVQKQIDALTSSAKQRASLDDANKVLQQIGATVKDRAMLAEQQPANAATVQGALRDLVAAFEAREAALKDETVAFEAERARWNGYYAARLARAQTECSITKTAPPKPPAQGKGK